MIAATAALFTAPAKAFCTVPVKPVIPAGSVRHAGGLPAAHGGHGGGFWVMMEIAVGWVVGILVFAVLLLLAQRA